jgi:hypothetical protein
MTRLYGSTGGDVLVAIDVANKQDDVLVQLRDVKQCQEYQNISKSIEIRRALKTRALPRKSIIFCALCFSAASYTR